MDITTDCSDITPSLSGFGTLKLALFLISEQTSRGRLGAYYSKLTHQIEIDLIKVLCLHLFLPLVLSEEDTFLSQVGEG